MVLAPWALVRRNYDPVIVVNPYSSTNVALRFGAVRPVHPPKAGAMSSVEQDLWLIFTYYTLHGNPLDPEHMRVS